MSSTDWERCSRGCGSRRDSGSTRRDSPTSRKLESLWLLLAMRSSHSRIPAVHYACVRRECEMDCAAAKREEDEGMRLSMGGGLG